TKFVERRETIRMRTIEKLRSIRLLVPFLLLAGAQIFAQAAANGTVPAADPASVNTTRRHADVLISDRTFIMKSIDELAVSQSLKLSGCASNFSIGDRCPVIDCPAPPPGCSYGEPDTNQNGCPINCGPLVCGPEQ